MARIFKVAENKKCGFCNWRVENLYLIAETEEEAKELYNVIGSGLCADCLIEHVIIPEEFELEKKIHRNSNAKYS